jgi:hypothetical protein
MRTTIDVPDALFVRAKKLALAKGLTFREAVLEGVRIVIERERAAPRPAFRLPDASFGEGGVVPGVAETDWDRIRDLVYEGRGG